MSTARGITVTLSLAVALIASVQPDLGGQARAPESRTQPAGAAGGRAASTGGPAPAVQRHQVTGMIISVDRPHRTFTASIQAIPDFMQAMTMPFEVKAEAELQGLAPGMVVQFDLVVERTTSYAERLRVVQYENTEQDPFSASRLTLLRDLAADRAKTGEGAVAIGAMVPDFALIDQARRPVSLSQLRGRVVVANFIYTSCALPNFCLRLSNNLSVLQKRFARQLGRDLVLLTVTFDPTHDTPEVMAAYASQWKADVAMWKFLTGPPADVERACRLFGVHAFANEGLLDHSLHTVIIDRQGTLVANIEGNQFTAAQLGDVTADVIAKIGRAHV